MNDALISIRDAAEFLGVSTKTLRRWEARGILVPLRTAGNQRRYSKKEILSFQKPNLYSKRPQNTTFVQDFTPVGKKIENKINRLESKGVAAITDIAAPEEMSNFEEIFQQELSNNQVAIESLLSKEVKKPILPFSLQHAKSFLLTGTAFVLVCCSLIFLTSFFSSFSLLSFFAEPGGIDGLEGLAKAKRTTEQVLAAATGPGPKISFNIPAIFKQGVLFEEPATISANLLGLGDNLAISSDTQTTSVTALVPTLSSNDTFLFENQAQTVTNKSISGATNTLSNIPNSALDNSSITINTSGNITGGGVVALGDSITLTGGSSGVTQITAGTDISISGSTGNVTINDTSTLATVTGRGATTSTDLTLNGAVTFGSTTTLNGIAYTWPSAQTAGYVLSTDGSGALSWISGSGLTVTWDSIDDPVANQSLAMSTYTTSWNWATGTGSNNLFNITTDASANGTGSLVNIQTGTSSTVNPLRVRSGSTEALSVNANGNVGIGTTDASAKLGIGANNEFRVSSTGDLTRINNVPYTWPSSASAGNNYVLTSQTDGTLAWTNTGSLASRWDLITDPAGNQTLAMAAYTTTWNWATATTGNQFSATANALTTGTLFDLSSTSTAGDGSKLLNLSRSGANATASKTNYGLYSAITNTGTTSTNVAGYFSASGGSNNYAGIFAAGNVGIGTTVPSTPLHVYTATTGVTPLTVQGVIDNTTPPGTALINLVNADTSGATTLTGIGFYHFNSGSSSVRFAQIDMKPSNVSAGSEAGDLVFSTRSDTSTITEKMRILGNGNVGIGTSNPSAALLQLGTAGTTTGSLNIQAATSGSITLKAAATTTDYTLTFPDTGGSDTYVLTTNGAGTTSWTDPGTLAVKWNNIASPDGNQTLTMAAYTTTWNWDSLTSGTGFTASSTSLSSGTLASYSVNSTAAASNTQKALSVSTAGANGTSTQTTYGLYATNTHTGTSSTNVAGYFSASGGSNNYAAIFNAGNVGIGTTAPASSLSIVTADPQNKAISIAGPSGYGIQGTGRAIYIGSVGNNSIGIEFSDLSGSSGFPTKGIQIPIYSSTGGQGIYIKNYDTVNPSINGGSGIEVNLTASSSTGGSNFSGNLIKLVTAKTITGANSVTDSGNFLNLSRTATTSNAGASYTITGDLATFSSTCTQTSGTCTDSARILNLTQSYASATGTILNISGAGTGLLLNADTTNSSANGALIDIQSSSSSQYGLKVTSNNGSTTGLIVLGDGNVGIGSTTPAYKLDIATSTASDRGINIANTAISGSGYGVYSSVSGAATTNTAGYFSAANASTNYALYIAAGNVNIQGLTASSGVYTDSNKNLTSTVPSSGTVGYWSRTGTTLSPATANDIVSIANTTTTGADLAITNTGVYTGTGIFNLTADSATSGDIINISASALTSGTALTAFGPSSTGVTDHFVKFRSDIGSGASLLYLNPDFSGSGVTGYGVYNTATDSTSNANTDYGYFVSLDLTGNAAKTGTATYSRVTSTSTTGDTLYAGDFAITASGALGGATTRTIYGIRSQPVNSGANSDASSAITAYGGYFNPRSTGPTTGTTTVYGGYFVTRATHAADAGTLNQYGVYVANDATASTNGTSTKYGLYIEPLSGADTNYSAYFGGNVGIGTTTPTHLLNIYNNSAITDSNVNAQMTIQNALATNQGHVSVILDKGASSATAAFGFNTAGTQKWDAGTIDSDDFVIRSLGSPNTKPFYLVEGTADYSIFATGSTVGIGTTSPGSRFSVNGSASFGSYATTAAPSNGLIVSGNVGIGTSNPSNQALAVRNSASSVTEAAGWTAQFGNTHANYNAGVQLGAYASTVGAIQGTDGTGANGRDLAINPAIGNVGIGTTSPAAKLGVRSTQTSGTLLQVGAASSTTLASALIGEDINLSTNYTNAAQSVTGLKLQMPATTAASTTTLQGIALTSGAVTNSAGTSTWTGLNITMPAITQSAGTLTSTGIKITGGTVTSGTAYALTTDAAAGNVGIGTATPAYNLAVVGTLNVTGAVTCGSGCSSGPWVDGGTEVYLTTSTDNVGIGTTSPSAKLGVSKTDTATTGFNAMVKNFATVAPSGTSDQTYIATWNSVDHSNTTSMTNGTIVGLYNQAQKSNTGTTTEAYATQNNLKLSSSGTITSAYGSQSLLQLTSTGTVGTYKGYYSELDMSTAGTVTNYYGFYAGNPDHSAGTVTNNYALYIEDQTGGGTLNYSLYSAGGTNYFGGNVGIGTTAPGTNTKLAISGGAITIANAGFAANASLHINAGTGSISTRYTQFLNNGGNVENLVSSDASNWYTWGTRSSNNTFGIVSGTDLSGAAGLNINTSGNVGIGTTSPTAANIQVTKPYTDASGTSLYTNPTISVTSTAANNFIGLRSYMNTTISTGISNTGYLRAGFFVALRENASDLGTLSEQSALVLQYGHSNTLGAATTTSSYGLYIQPYQGKAGSTITNAYGIRIDAPVQTGATVTNNYGIYQQGTSQKNYFGGNVGIGTTTTSYQLVVGGSGAAADGILVNTSAYTSIPNPGSVADKNIFNARGIGLSADTTTLSSAYQPTTGIGIAINRASVPTLALKNSGGPSLLIEAGNVGIGTSGPSTKLHIVDNSAGASVIVNQAGAGYIQEWQQGGNQMAAIRNDGYIKMQLTTNNNQGLCWVADGSTDMIVDCSSAPTDLAENFGTSDPSIEAGDLVVADGQAQQVPDPHTPGKITSKAYIKKAVGAYQPQLIGVVSTSPNQLYGDDGLFNDSENPRPVSLAGRVPTKVSTENGTIKTGDLLTSSSTPGVAMKATHPGQVIGRALQDYSSDNVGKIIVLIKVGFGDPGDVLTTLSLDNNGQPVANGYTAWTSYSDERLKTNIAYLGNGVMDKLLQLHPAQFNYNELTGYDQATLNQRITGLIAQNVLSVFPEMVGTANINGTQYYDTNLSGLQIYLLKGVQELATTTGAKYKINESGELEVPSLKVKNASDQFVNVGTLLSDLDSRTSTNSAVLGAQISDVDTKLSNHESRIASLESLTATLASQSALLQTLIGSSSATFAGLDELNVNEATISGTLNVLGRSTFADVGITGDVNIGLITIDGLEGTINTLADDLKIQPLALAGVDFLNGKVKIDTSGNVVVKESITAKKYVIDTTSENDKTLGSATITPGQTQVTVSTTSISSESKVFVTATSQTQKTLVVSGKQSGSGFTVSVDSAPSSDLNFDWFIVDEKSN